MEVLVKSNLGKTYQITKERKQGAVLLPAINNNNDAEIFLKATKPKKPTTWKLLLASLSTSDPSVKVVPSQNEQKAFEKIVALLGAKTLFVSEVIQKPASKGKKGGARNASEAPALGDARSDVAVPLSSNDNGDAGTVVSDAPGKVTEEATVGASPIDQTETRGCPISMVSGEELLSLSDCTLPGPVPFTWTRTYRSGHSRDAGLGCGWTHSGSEQLYVEGLGVDLSDAEGRTLRFQLPRGKQCSRYLPEGMDLIRLSDDGFLLKQQGQWDKVFLRLGQTQIFRLSQLRHTGYRVAEYNKESGKSRDEKGYAVNFYYDAQNKLNRIAGNWGKSLQLTRDKKGRVVHVDLHNESRKVSKRVAEYDYDEKNDLVAQRNAKGVGETYQYNHHLLMRRTLVTGFNYYYQWDSLDNQARCLRNWGDDGIYDYRFTWDLDNQSSQATDSRGYTTSFEYNDYGQVVKEVDNEGGEHHYTYASGRKTSYTDPLGNTTQFFFDGDNNPTGYRNALGHSEVSRYFQGQQTAYSNQEGARWQRQYNARGLVSKTTDPLGRQTHFKYNDTGLLQEVQDSEGQVQRFYWNDSAELVSVTDSSGMQRHFSYDAWGQAEEVTTKINAKVAIGTVKFHYSATGLIEKVVAADGGCITYHYNDNDQLVRYSDARGRLTAFEYDGLSQVVRRIDSEGYRLQYEYDKERNLTALINENNERYQFYYDGNERLIKEIGFDGREQHYKYNEAGQLIKHMDAGEIITEFERDALGQMLTKRSRSLVAATSKNVKTGAIPPAEELSRFTYSPSGRLKEVYNNDQYLAFEYNRLGQVIQEHHSDLNANKQRVKSSMRDIGFDFDSAGMRSGLNLPDGQSIKYYYDSNRQLQSVGRNGQLLTEINRDALGRETSRRQGSLTAFSDYDPMGRLKKQWTTNQEVKSGERPPLSPIYREYHYSQFGNLERLTDGSRETRYVYDLLDRLEKVEGEAPEQFSFDPAGNLLVNRSSDENKNPTKGKSSQSAIGNRLLMQGDRKFEYDKRGNLIQERRGKGGKLTTDYVYNHSNQLIRVEKAGQTTTYKYDPLGRRIEKTDSFGSTQYLWAGDQLVQEERKNIKKTYVYEPNSFKPLAFIENEQVYHYHLDHLGTPRELSDEAGKIVWKVQYKTYGSVALKEVEEVENNLRFQGQYFDEETGLHYNRHRYYNPNTGQFTTQDPIGLLGGVNNYQYAPNPTGWVDPLGLSCKEGKYETTPMIDKYVGENKPGHSEWSFFGPDVAVTYLDANKRQEFEVGIEKGLLVHKGGALAGTPVDTLDAGDAWSGTGKAIFVMDAQGKVYLSNTYPVAEFHHSSFLSGAPVASAGTMNVANGVILEMSNDSGHYQPAQALNDQAINELKEQGFSEDQAAKIARLDYDN